MAINTSALVVPIQVNGIYINDAQTVTRAKADFSRLPWSDGQQDFNSSTPFLGESVLSPPFQDRNFNLGAGVHLHWVLPEVLRTYSTQKTIAGTKKSPPAAPNRWLITREDGMAWVVESDYIHPTSDSSTFNVDAVTVPNSKMGAENTQPYFYMGRQLTFDQWKNEAALPGSNYWASLGNGPLTAFGYGDLSFNAFYPNCRSVFGFHDPAPLGIDESVSYQVLGWYADATNDIVQTTLSEVNNLIAQPSNYPHLLRKIFNPKNTQPSWMSQLLGKVSPFNSAVNTQTLDNIRALLLDQNGTIDLSSLLTECSITDAFTAYALQQLLSWAAAAQNDWITTPAQSLFLSSVTIHAKADPAPCFDQAAIGKTGAEAIAAYLSNVLGNGTNNATIESQLLALQLKPAVQHDLVDIDLNLKEAAFNHTFSTAEGGILWRIRNIKQGAASASTETVALPFEIAPLLDTLNTQQNNYQSALQNLNSECTELYSAWNKYMFACYPPLGEGQDYPDKDVMKDFLLWKLNKTGLKQQATGAIAIEEGGGISATTGLSQQVLQAYTTLINALKSVNTTTAGEEYELSMVAGPRFYKPKNPVLLYAASNVGDINQSTASDAVSVVFTAQGLPSSPTIQDAYAIGEAAPMDVSNQSTSAAWSPQILQWLGTFSPEKAGSNFASVQSNYSSDYITSNFAVAAEDFDFTPTNSTTTKEVLEYSGTSYVAAGVKEHLLETLQDFLMAQAAGKLTTTDFQQGQSIGSPFATCFTTTAAYTNPQYTAYQAYNTLVQTTVFTQALDGFNDGFLQHMQNIQLPIADPLGFSAYQQVTDQINTALKGAYLPSVAPDNQFLPVYTGAFSLMKSAVIDHFGRSNRLDFKSLTIAQSLRNNAQPNAAWFNPRLAQETRCNFRWLAASLIGASAVEMNNHPATSPICGWLLPNFFDNSIDVYAPDGSGLGMLSSEGWKSFPGGHLEIATLADLPNTINVHFKNVLQALNNLSLQDFISNVDAAQQLIAPEYYSSNSLALLVGKPIAVVRAQISLETKGQLAKDQGWVPFQQQLQGEQPLTDQVENISIPFRIGESGQLNDGLLGFWNENDPLVEAKIKWVTNTESTGVPLSLNQQPVALTMLMDPHGIVHATSGLLPVKTIQIPAEQYRPALQHMELVFRTQPLLTSTAKLQLSLPKEQGYTWSWMNRGNDSWTVPQLTLLSETSFTNGWTQFLQATQSTSPTAATVWNALLSSNWVTPDPNNAAYFQVSALNSAIAAAMKTAGFSADQQQQIQETIDSQQTGMVPFEANAQFTKSQHLIEGYLKLSPKD